VGGRGRKTIQEAWKTSVDLGGEIEKKGLQRGQADGGIKFRVTGDAVLTKKYQDEKVVIGGTILQRLRQVGKKKSQNYPKVAKQRGRIVVRRESQCNLGHEGSFIGGDGWGFGN